MKILKLLLVLFFVSNSHACLHETDGLIGKAKLEYYFWDIYNIGLYDKEKTSRIEIQYLRDLSKSDLMKGWEKGLELNIKDKTLYDSMKKWLEEITPNVVKNDCLVIEKNKDNKVTSFKLNSKTIATSDNKNFYQYIFSPWIGEQPVKEYLKKSLLGK